MYPRSKFSNPFSNSIFFLWTCSDDLGFPNYNSIGFDINEKSLRRAGLDYIKNVDIKIFENIDDFLTTNEYKRYLLVTKYGHKSYESLNYSKGDCFIFGSESKGLSHEVFKKFKCSEKISIPMASKSISINLANSVAICI